MSKPEIKNLPASIQDRLLKQARFSGRPFNELLQYYAIERFLYRLSQSKHVGQFVLKGALLSFCLYFEHPTHVFDFFLLTGM